MRSFLRTIIISILVFCMAGQFICYSAIVSDNDGSAFVTKAEFDALKNSFNKQIDDYNSSIDGKIDGAIASYLAGIQLVKKMPYEIPNAWDYVYFMNGNIAPTWKVPEMDILYSYTAKSATNTQNLKQLVASGQVRNNYTWSSSETCLRPLFGLLSGSESSVGNVYWRGIAQRYHEKWDIFWTKNDIFSDLEYLDAYPTSCKIIVYYMFRINKTGYYSDLKSSSFYQPTVKYQYSSEKSASSVNVFKTLVFPLVYLDEYNGKTTDYDHIVQYDKTTNWDLSNELFCNTFRVHTSNTSTDTSLYNSRASSLSSADTRYIAGKYEAQYFAGGSISSTQFKQAGSTLSSIGMLSAKAASSIYQLDKEKSITVNKKNFNIPNKTLEAGFQLCASTENTDIEWHADFSEVYCYNGSSYVTDANEVDIYLSYEPFSDKLVSSDLIRCDGSSQDYVTTNSRKAVLKWKQTKDSVVYIKCVPHFTGTSYINNDWRVKLNLTGGSKNFYVMVEE